MQIKQKITRSHVSLILFVALFASLGSYFLVSSHAASIPAIYIAQTSAGTANGSDCADAEPVTFFNTAGNWGTNTGQIGPGTTVHLCGTITSALTAHGSGTSGSPVTVIWESGARLSEPVCPGTGCFNTNNQTYLTLNGGSNGVIESTANGTNLANKVGGAEGINATSCSNCTIENLTIQNMYVHASTSDTTIDGSQNRGIYFSGSNINILNNTMHDIGWALLSQWQDGNGNINIANNNIYNIDHGFASTGVGGGITVGTIQFDHNNVHDFSSWDTGVADAYHHDGIHCFAGWTGSYEHLSGFYIYDNTFGGSTGTNMNAMIFLEGGQGSGFTPCGDSTSKVYIFNNTFSGTSPLANGFMGLYSTSPQIYNNTMTGYTNAVSSSLCIQHDSGSNYETTAESFSNNILSTCNNAISSYTGTYASGQPDYNLYANEGNNAFSCNASSTPSFTTWRSCIGGDAHSATTTNALLNSDDSLQSGSPAIGAGTNLTSLCTGNLVPLCSDINGNARPTSGAWDAGAFQFSTNTPPPTVTGDLNNDNHVNIVDLSIFLSHWQQTGTGLAEDFNSDNVVNIVDLSILLSHYGS